MKGMNELIKARLKGQIPEVIRISLDYDDPTATVADLRVHPGDSLLSLDLRGVQGLPVIVNGSDGARAKAIAKACHEAGASRTITNISLGGRVIEVEDSAGLFTWKQ